MRITARKCKTENNGEYPPKDHTVTSNGFMPDVILMEIHLKNSDRKMMIVWLMEYVSMIYCLRDNE